MDIQIVMEDGAAPKDHEIQTVMFLIKHGKSPKFLAEKVSSHTKNPDIRMDNLEWEMKCPTGSGKENLEHAFKAAVKQSENILFDLRRSKIPHQKALAKLQRELALSRKAKRLYVIAKDNELLYFEK